MNHFRRSIVAILLLLAGCAGPNSRVATKLNKDAALIGAIPSDPLHWVAITSGAKADDPTMYILDVYTLWKCPRCSIFQVQSRA
jgi:hypothetical protein